MTSCGGKANSVLECSLCHAAELGTDLQAGFMHCLCRNPPIAKGALPLQGHPLFCSVPHGAALFPAPVASSALCIHTTLIFQLCPLAAPPELCGAVLLWPGALRGFHGVLLGPGLGQHALLHPGLPADGDLLRHDRQGQCREQLRRAEPQSRNFCQQPHFQGTPGHVCLSCGSAGLCSYLLSEGIKFKWFRKPPAFHWCVL